MVVVSGLGGRKNPSAGPSNLNATRCATMIYKCHQDVDVLLVVVRLCADQVAVTQGWRFALPKTPARSLCTHHTPHLGGFKMSVYPCEEVISLGGPFFFHQW